MSKKINAAKKSSSKSSKGSKAAPVVVARQRVTLLELSVTSVLKWMGAKGHSTEQATNVVSKLASGPDAKSTIATGLSDGKNPKYVGTLPKIDKQTAAKIKRVAV